MGVIILCLAIFVGLPLLFAFACLWAAARCFEFAFRRDPNLTEEEQTVKNLKTATLGFLIWRGLKK